MISVYCITHCTNLAMQTNSNLGIVVKIEDVLYSLYFYFFHNLKKTYEFVKLIDIVEITC
jgi:hypothetical protein